MGEIKSKLAMFPGEFIELVRLIASQKSIPE
jgi:hypothetical protein